MTREEQIEKAWQLHLEQKFPRVDIEIGELFLTPFLKEQLAEAQNWRCCYCGDKMEGVKNDPKAPTWEHIVPRSQDGTNKLDNLVIACNDCNNKRGNRPLHKSLHCDM